MKNKIEARFDWGFYVAQDACAQVPHKRSYNQKNKVCLSKPWMGMSKLIRNCKKNFVNRLSANSWPTYTFLTMRITRTNTNQLGPDLILNSRLAMINARIVLPRSQTMFSEIIDSMFSAIIKDSM